ALCIFLNYITTCLAMGDYDLLTALRYAIVGTASMCLPFLVFALFVDMCLLFFYLCSGIFAAVRAFFVTTNRISEKTPAVTVPTATCKSDNRDNSHAHRSKAKKHPRAIPLGKLLPKPAVNRDAKVTLAVNMAPMLVTLGSPSAKSALVIEPEPESKAVCKMAAPQHVRNAISA
ncbi:hypothetical protein LPJ75_004007, partial [Coemansia sp. RSA 2598]